MKNRINFERRVITALKIWSGQLEQSLKCKIDFIKKDNKDGFTLSVKVSYPDETEEKVLST